MFFLVINFVFFLFLLHLLTYVDDRVIGHEIHSSYTHSMDIVLIYIYINGIYFILLNNSLFFFQNHKTWKNIIKH